MKNDLFAPLRDLPITAWRSLAQKRGDASATIEQEFPHGDTPPTGLARRDMLKLAGASVALASAACIRRNEEEILPYTKQPEEVIPGVPSFYATVHARSEGAVGLLVESHEGRPTKIEGNPSHPSSLGSADVWAQAEVLKLYDPDRARAPKNGGKDVAWSDWDTFSKAQFTKLATGQGLAVLLDHSDSPSTSRVVAAGLLNRPNAKVYRHDALAATQTEAGAVLAFGAGSRVHFDVSKADVILALDSNFLGEGPEHLRHARAFGKRRRFVDVNGAKSMGRLYAAEPVWSSTGSAADHRFRVASGAAPGFLRAIADALSAAGVVIAASGGPAADTTHAKAAAAVAKDLAAHKGAAVIIVGERQPAAVHAFAYAINAALGALETGAMSVSSGGPNVEAAMTAGGDIAALVASLEANEVDTLVIVDGNPAYTAPNRSKLVAALAKAKTVVHAGVVVDETAKLATWHVPLAHFLESWSDARAWDGTASIVQPLIHPLHGARPALALLAQAFGLPGVDASTGDKALVEQTWRAAGASLADAKAWRRALHDGVIAGSARAAGSSTVLGAEISAALGALKVEAPTAAAMELVVVRGNLLDGRLANVSWCQELPDPHSKLCWDNALLVAPKTAKALGLDSDVKKNAYAAALVDVTAGGATVRMPAFILPGIGEHTVAVVWGYGRTGGGEVAMGGGVDPGTFTVNAVNPAVGHGVDPGPLLTASAHVVSGVSVKATGGHADLCSTQDHFYVPGNPFKELSFAELSAEDQAKRKMGLGRRAQYRKGSLKMYEDNARFGHTGDIPANLLPLGSDVKLPTRPLQLTNDIIYENQQWGMVIDLTACIGCSACTIACQAENNIPAVGRHEVLIGREMHWMRIDRYFTGDVDDPESGHVPINCMQCENAPCEPVCPVSATVHDDEGLNSMAYNRCIGTRYCANNCPYKVRRFNYLDFTSTGNVYVDPAMEKRMKTARLQRNPDVTVRYRGVMEKCTYCTQRIEEAKVAAKRRGEDRRALPDGAITPACAQTCPTGAITFGNIDNKDSAVAKLRASDRNYEMLQDLNVRPRTTYLARLKNTNEELA